ncbi:Hypothetical predicted protein [Pelobates cultripes]|uniref:Uncharacterized protein n=1 Tax=Pelobates cultripes TaxID=61616 RepID=A0AAD1VQ22_PELCU|nr:Hypothetical predicted protein [Pelobates cultripes]
MREPGRPRITRISESGNRKPDDHDLLGLDNTTDLYHSTTSRGQHNTSSNATYSATLQPATSISQDTNLSKNSHSDGMWGDSYVYSSVSPGVHATKKDNTTDLYHSTTSRGQHNTTDLYHSTTSRGQHNTSSHATYSTTFQPATSTSQDTTLSKNSHSGVMWGDSHVYSSVSPSVHTTKKGW